MLKDDVTYGAASASTKCCFAVRYQIVRKKYKIR